MKTKLHSSIIVTYRCNARCNICNTWQNPSRPGDEIRPQLLEKLPSMFFTNITGGEPFVREDLPEIVEVLRKKSKRLVISTNGYFTDRIISICKRFPEIGIRISMDGLAKNNDQIRGIQEGFDKGISTLLELRELGIKDIGIGITVQDLNCGDIVPLYLLAKGLGLEFATAAVHNSYYFHKWDNKIEDKKKVNAELMKLIRLFFKSKKVKDWFRAYFNYGLINYIQGNKRFLPCDMGQQGFFLDPWGDVLSCNGMDEKRALGNLREQSWNEIWNGKQAQEVRKSVKDCKKNCWMIGSVAPAIWHHPTRPIAWILKNKIRQMLGKDINFCEIL
ncbi:MAG TPA: radical SAM protein [Candidatus Omnitrophica bacterium]|nr:radical SAM protein [Candidatus Omnitrophota bacterium]